MLTNHVYQNTRDGFLIFYSVSDYLVFFTILCVVARKCPVTITDVNLMPDHVHLAVVEKIKGALSSLMRDTLSRFSRVHNAVCGMKGPLFNPRFGSVVKTRDKDARSCIIYIDNNPVERHLCERAEQYRWGFLAYAENHHPFSAPIKISKCSRPLRYAVQVVKSRHHAGYPLSYQLLQIISRDLKREEREQLIDFIIGTYSVICYEDANRFFDSFADRLIADHSVSAREYDINEVFAGKSDAYYAKMSRIILKEKGYSDIHEILSLSLEEKHALFRLLHQKTAAPAEQIRKYLRIPKSHVAAK